MFIDDGSDLELGAVFQVVGLQIAGLHMMRIRHFHRHFPGRGTTADTPPPDWPAEASFAP